MLSYLYYDYSILLCARALGSLHELLCFLSFAGDLIDLRLSSLMSWGIPVYTNAVPSGRLTLVIKYRDFIGGDVYSTAGIRSHGKHVYISAGTQYQYRCYWYIYVRVYVLGYLRARTAAALLAALTR